MLSQNLKSLRTMLDDSENGGLYMSQEHVSSISNILKTAIDDARALENAQIPAALKLGAGDLKNNNIVRFPVIARPIPNNPTGGNAA